MSTDLHTQPIFSGKYDHALDGKNRIIIPSDLRQSDADEFYIIPEHNNQFLILMPPGELKKTSEKITSLSGVSPNEKGILLRSFFSKARRAFTDKQGRLLLPEDYCEAVGLKAAVVIAGADKRIEIWNPERWEETFKAGEATASRLAYEVGL
jgi:MraZ protein